MDLNTPAWPAETGPGLKDAVRAEQLKLLLTNRVDLYAAVLWAAVVVAVDRNVYPGWLLAFWFFLACGLVLTRSLLAHRFGAVTLPSHRTLRRWSIFATAAATAHGVLWGLCASAICLSPDLGIRVFTMIMLGGMMAGGMMASAAAAAPMLGFALPAIIPAILAMATRPGAMFFGFAVMQTFYALIVINAALKFNRGIIETMRLRFAQAALLAKLQISESAMAEAQKLAKVGSWDVDLITGRGAFSAEAYDIFGVEPASFQPNFKTALARVHPDDRPVLARYLAAFSESAALPGIDLRLVMDDGAIKYVRDSRRKILGTDGKALRLIGSVQDITERRLSEDRLQFANLVLKTQMDALPAGILIVDANRHLIDFNQRFAEIWGIPPAGLINPADDAIRARMEAKVKAPLDYAARVKFLAEHPEEVGNDEIEMADGRLLERFSRSLYGAGGEYLGRVWFFSDITERKQAAAMLDYRDRLLHAVTAATSVAVRAISLADGVQAALPKIGESMGVQRILIIQDMPGEIPPLAVRFRWEAADIAVPFELIATGEHQFDPVEMAAWTGPLQDGVAVFADTATAKGAVLDMLTFYDIKSAMLMPVHVGRKVWGFIGIADCKAVRQWTVSEIETLGILADTAGALIVRERARLALETSEELFRLLAATAKDAVILTGPSGEVLQWNAAAARIFGYTAAEAVGKDASQLIVRPQDRAMVIRNTALAIAELAMTFEFTLIRKDGSEIATEISVSAMPIGNQHGILSILRDITERKSAQEKLQFANIMLKTQMEASPDGIIAVDSGGNIVSYNQRYAEMWSMPVSLLRAGAIAPVRAALAASMKDPEAFIARVTHLLANPGEISDDEIETADGRLVERHSRTLQSGAGENLGRIWFFRDITARRKAEALALSLARFDVLTGLANRAVFIEAVERAIAGVKRGNAGFAVLYLDLDHFKDVNDTLGHPAGDALLAEVANRLRANIRETDTIARFGGDEFAIVATEIDDPADAADFAEKLVNAIAAPVAIAGNIIHVKTSIGIDLHSPRAADTETLLSHADVALYRAKTEGRGTYRFFTATMDRDVHQRVMLIGELREALARDQLFLVYQPQVATASGRITGVEALLRWRHPTRGVLAPENFVSVAESTGLIGVLGHFVLWTACRQAKAWMAAGLPPIRISVNVPALQFKAALALEADIIGALNETGLPPNLLELELTEAALMGASREQNDVLLRLRQRGVKLSIDEFGTGYSTLNYLRRLPVDHIKIAQSFINHVETEAGDASIVRAILGLARVLDIDVIAEGIAARSQLELLQSWGCGEMQGFYFARPLPAEDIAGLLQSGGTIWPPASNRA